MNEQWKILQQQGVFGFGFDENTFSGWVPKVVSDAVDTVSEAADSVGKKVGISTLTDPFKDLVEGPLRDFANTGVGKVMLTAMAGLAYGPLALSVIGPQWASFVIAFPGVMRGDKFQDAYAQEAVARTKAVVEAYAPKVGEMVATKFAASFEAMVPDLSAKLIREMGGVDKAAQQVTGMSGQQIAAKLGLSRIDVALAVKSVITQNLDELVAYTHASDYDARVGKRVGLDPSKLHEVHKALKAGNISLVHKALKAGNISLVHKAVPVIEDPAAATQTRAMAEYRQAQMASAQASQMVLPSAAIAGKPSPVSYVGGGAAAAGLLALGAGLAAPVALPLAAVGALAGFLFHRKQHG